MLATIQPNLSVIPAAVVALIRFPRPGTNPTNVLPSIADIAPSIIDFAVVSVISLPKTAPRLIIIPICIAVIGTVSDHRSCTRPHHIAPAASEAV